MNKSRFIYSSILMVFMNVFIRLIGFSYEVLLSRYLGAEAIGLFEIAVSTLMVFLILINSGTSTSVTKLVAEQQSKGNYKNVERIFNSTLKLNLYLSVLISFFIVIFAEKISLFFLKSRDMVIGVYLLVPAIILISTTSVYKSYFYGLKNIVVPSFGEIIEGSAKMIIIMSVLFIIYPLEPIKAAILAISGIGLGEFFNLLWYLYSKKRYSKKLISNKEKEGSFLLKIITMSLPLTISGVLSAILRFINTIMIPNRLIASGYTSSQAISTIGRVMGMTMPLIHLPFIVTNALVVNMIPSLTEQLVLKKYKDIKNDVELSIKVSLLVSIPLMALYLLLSKSFAVFLYSDSTVGEYIRIMSFGTILIALQHNFTGVLYGINKQVIATVTRLIGMVIQLILMYILVGNPSLGIYGIFIANYCSMFVVMAIDLITLRKSIKFNFHYWDILGKPILASIFMIIIINLSNYNIDQLQNTNALAFVFSLLVGGLAYLLALVVTKAIPRNLFSRFLTKKY